MPTKSPSHIASRAFTLPELLATIAILAVLVVSALVFVPSYTAWAQRTADQQTLTILNDTLTRYKCQGGDLTALTADAHISNVLQKLGSTINWNGMKHHIMQRGVTYQARSIGAFGDGRDYQFFRYNTYTTSLPSLPAGATAGSGANWYWDGNTLVLLSGTLTLGSDLAGKNIVVSGGTLTFDSAQSLGSLIVNGGGRAMLSTSGSYGGKVLQANSISVGGSLDLTNNTLIVHGGNQSALVALARDTGAAGIFSANVSGDATGHRTIVVDTGQDANDNSHIGDDGLDGVALLSGDVFVKPTIKGDATLDGYVDNADYSRLAGCWGSDTTWVMGDFNGDGQSDQADLDILTSTFHQYF